MDSRDELVDFWRRDMSAKVTVGLCVKNSENEVETALDSVARQDFPHELMKLVVVDENSTDKTLSVVRDFVSKIDVKTQVLCSNGKGLGASRQIAVDNTEGDYIIWVDDDFVLSKDFVRNHVDFMEKNPDVGAAQAKEIPTRNSLMDTLESLILVAAYRNPEKILGGDVTVFRLKALKQIGGYDVNIKGAGEDIDISNRLKQSGWILAINNQSEFYHRYPPTTLTDLWKRYLWYGYGNHFNFHKYKVRNLVLSQFPPLVLIIGVRDSILVYRATNEKKAFLIVVRNFLRSTPHFLGFVRAHLEGYGHTVNNES